MILYLHGFRSSPNSYKSRLMATELQKRNLAHQWFGPQLPASPAQAIALCNEIIQQQIDTQALKPEQDLVIIGSSLGGYYAAVLAERWNCRSVLLNPAVHAARDLATQVGTHTQYHSDAPFHFLPEYVDELAAMQPQKPANPQRCLLVAAKGDELLDWREMVAWYKDSHVLLLEGSDHGISDFEQYLPQVLDFALSPDTAQYANPTPDSAPTTRP